LALWQVAGKPVPLAHFGAAPYRNRPLGALDKVANCEHAVAEAIALPTGGRWSLELICGSAAMKIIFLDYDGVLINRESLRTTEAEYPPADESIRLLNDLIKQTDAQIVVSSSWRIRRTLIELQEILEGWGVDGTVLDKTPHYPEQDRGAEIQQWLDDRRKSKGDVEAFVILDDCRDMPTLLDFLVQTEFETGLTREDAEKALQILNQAGATK
jgi:hypothetical protein